MLFRLHECRTVHESCSCTGGRAGPEAVLLPEFCSMDGGMCCEGLQCSLFLASVCLVYFATPSLSC